MSTLAVDAIQNAAGTSAASIGSNGEITTSHNLTSSGVITGNYLIDNNYPIFHGRGIAGFQSAGYLGVGANIVCPSGYSQDIAQGNLLQTDGTFQAPADGLYEFYVWTGATAGGASGHRGLYVYHRNAAGTSTGVIHISWTNSDYGHYDLVCHRFRNMVQGDKILWGYHNSYLSWHQGEQYFNCWARRIK